MWMALNSLLIDKSNWRNSISNMDTLIGISLPKIFCL